MKSVVDRVLTPGGCLLIALGGVAGMIGSGAAPSPGPGDAALAIAFGVVGGAGLIAAAVLKGRR